MLRDELFYDMDLLSTGRAITNLCNGFQYDAIMKILLSSYNK
jgi:hypothetical protein